MEDEAIDNLYLALIQCFAIVLCGYIAGRLNIITKSEANGLNTFVGTFALPSLIFTSLAKLDFTLVNWRFLLAVLFAKSCVFIVVLVVTIIITKPPNPSRAALFAIFTTQSNDFAIGYPMINALYGKTYPEYPAYLYLMAPISLAILNPIGFVLLEIGKQNAEERMSYWRMVYSVGKGIVLNPVLFMTVLGIGGNLIFSHAIPASLAAILDVFGNAFSASALFLLGLMMVGKVHKLKGAALVIPGILISIKLLALPLGFLYGTIPTAPALFIFSLRYNLEIDLIASAMVACTFLSAPLMFVSAKLINAVAAGVTPANYALQLSSFSFDVSAASAVICVWLLACFSGLAGGKYKCATHRCTFHLILSQLAVALGVIMWTKLKKESIGSPLWYIQFFLITIGVYASRIWTTILAMTSLFLSSQSAAYVRNMQRCFISVGLSVPIIIVILMATTLPLPNGNLEFVNPNFQFGRSQAVISISLLIFCFVVTVGCLVLQQRYQRGQNVTSSYANLASNDEASATNSLVRGAVVDVEDLVSPLTSAPICDFQNGCQNGICRISEDECCERDFGDTETNGDIAIDSDDPQLFRHLILLIFLLCSMFLGLSVCIGMLIMEQLTGIYAELAFLDIALNFGQSLIIFGVFGLDSGLGKLGCWLREACRKWRAGKELQLPNEDSLSPEAIAIREQFSRCHLAECRARIAMCRRRMLKVHKGVFSGRELVNWLLEAGLAENREEAVRYGRCLLESRVLRHIDGTHHFSDQNLLYAFSA